MPGKVYGLFLYTYLNGPISPNQAQIQRSEGFRMQISADMSMANTNKEGMLPSLFGCSMNKHHTNGERTQNPVRCWDHDRKFTGFRVYVSDIN